MTYTNPLFSIIIVNYNHGRFLEEAIQSILNQSCKDFELIIIDGGSTDNSLNVIKKYARKLSWWISEPDNGQSDAFNKGFSNAKGKFFFWVNADDLLLPGSLNYAKKAIEENQTANWFAANTIFFNSTGIINKCSVGPKWNDFLIKHNPIYVYGPTSIFHRDLFFRVNGFDLNLKYTMDGDLWYKFYNTGAKFIRINNFFWGFRIHDESKTSHAFKDKPNEKFADERRDVVQKNNHKLLKSFSYMLVIYKLIFGVFLKSFFYTTKFKGKSIKLIK